MPRRLLVLSLPLLSLPLLSLAVPACGGSTIQIVDPAGEDTGAGAETGTPPADGAAETIFPTDDTGPSPDTGAPPPDTGTSPVDTGGPDPTDAGPTTCAEPGAKVYGGHCYFRLETARGFALQRAACAAFPGKVHLATITTAGEQDFIQTNFGPTTDRWIGLMRGPTDPATKASYKWITGETSTFDAWAAGEPNGSGECARMRGGFAGAGGQWADYYCDNAYSAICERE